MKLKKVLCIGAAVMMSAFLLAGCGSAPAEGGSSAAPAADAQKSVANARLQEGNRSVMVTIDLSGGWSVEFAEGAFYLSDHEPSADSESVAIGITLADDVYQDYVDEANKSDSKKDVEGGISYVNDSGETAYLFKAGDVGMMLTVNSGVDSDAVYARVKAEAEAGAAEEDDLAGNKVGYSGNDPAELAVYQYLIKEIASGYEEADASIPVVTVIEKDESNPDDVLVKGDFWVWNYNIDGDTLKTASGGAHPGCMHMKKNEDGSYEVTSFDPVKDGAELEPSAKEIFGDKYEEFAKVSSDDKAREEKRLEAVQTYVNANEVPCTKYQDEGWDPVDLHL